MTRCARLLETVSIRNVFAAAIVAATLCVHAAVPALAQASPAPDVAVAVGPQYDTSHVYVAPADFDRFLASFVATSGGTLSTKGAFTVTPTPSKTYSQVAFTPGGLISVFGFTTPIPYPSGMERTGYLVSDIDAAVTSARAHGAAVVVASFNDPIGKDAVIEWPGGVFMQLYWHTKAPSYAPLAMVPDNRVYVSPDAADAFIRDFTGFAHGTVVSDIAAAPGSEIGRPDAHYRRVRIQSPFGKMVVIVSDGFLPYPYGHETTGYAVPHVAETLKKATAAGATILVPAFATGAGQSAMIQFPGGYIGEIHTSSNSAVIPSLSRDSR
jgi:predicted enzyme related to lactoylglutathione lyase